MGITILELGAICVKSKYLELRKNTYYFRRRIPRDVAHLYPEDDGTLFFSLKTSDIKMAARLAQAQALRQDALWKSVRVGEDLAGPEVRRAAEAYLEAHGLRPGQHVEFKRYGIEPDQFLSELAYLSESDNPNSSIDETNLPPHVALAAELYYGAKPIPTLTEAVALHRELSGSDVNDQRELARNKAVGSFLSIAGDLPIDSYTRVQANEFVRQLLSSGLKTATVKRYLNYISPVFSTAIAEYELNKPNVFHGLKIPRYGEDTEARLPYTDDELQAFQALCRCTDDRLRWAMAMLSDTGMRLAEVVGLRSDDIVLDGEVPFVFVRENSTRRLKTAASIRQVPLVGCALWASQRLLESTEEGLLFPHYSSQGSKGFRTASTTMNKWARENGFSKPMHSLRHTMRDRLRNVGASEEIQDRIGGWSNKSVGRSYGQGHSLAVLHSWMARTVLEPYSAR